MCSTMNETGRLLATLALVLLVGCARTRVVPLVPMPEPGPAAQGTYRIQPGDQLEVKFLYQPEMNAAVPVRPDGRITLETTGEIDAVGRTPAELEETIRVRSADHLRDPAVVVIVTQLGEQRIYVGGEVLRPGYVVMRPGMTPLQAIVHAGGFKDTAQLDSVMLISRAGGGEAVASRVDMDQVVSEGVPERLQLAPDDVIFVPRTRIANMNLWVDQYIRGLFPTLPRVGAGYSLNNGNR
jgi:protein involved in polysaccharide export with SLBB domain